ncbi:GntR family transcriptional regulator [Rhizorhabdus wittichii]|uniref:GntR family transcriptional regulator n=1 Tax=Rhizorhabdus wittichii TaxID=160791 RepID=A0A975D3P8_9SPHN|nr:GntR family transcriptional regulator [Rhizorhabdus wittichii]QTH21701.1 GntR family transcriptional regulator [Rhizorhabdus wittichii]
MGVVDRIAATEGADRIRESGNISAQVHALVLEHVQRGDLAPDEKLVDINLAKRLNISRMPVREALVRLVNEGYLVGTSRGFALAQLDARAIADIFEIRRLIEPHAAALVASAIDAAGLAELDESFALFEGSRPGGKLDEMRRGLTDFRLVWTRYISNSRLAATISRFADHCQIVRAAALHDGPTQALVGRLIGNLLESFRAHDPAAAHRAITVLLDESERHLA